jgi:hypothetical protein
MQPMMVRGQWWLPATPDDRQTGTFVLDAEQCSLTLDRSFASLAPPPANESGVVAYDGLIKVVHEPVVYGVSDDGQDYSLLDCTTYRSCVEAETTGEQHSVTAAITGSRLPGKSLAFDKATVTYSHLLDWTGWLGLQMASSTDGAETAFKVNAGTKRRATYCLDEAVLHLEEHRPYSRESRSFSIQQEAQLTVELSKPMEWPDLVHTYVRPLNDFLSFATLTASTFGEILVHVPGEQASNMLPLSFRSIDMRRTDKKHRLHAVDMLFTLDDTADWPNVFKSWFELHSHYRHTLQQLLASQYAPFEWAENSFLAAARAADSFHRYKFKQQQPYSKAQIDSVIAAIEEHLPDNDLREYAVRVVRGGNFFPQPEQFGKLLDYTGKVGANILATEPNFVKAVKDVRNGLTHPNSKGNPGVLRRYHLEQALRWVVRTCLLKELGFKDDTLHKLLQRNRYYGSEIAELGSDEQPTIIV